MPASSPGPTLVALPEAQFATTTFPLSVPDAPAEEAPAPAETRASAPAPLSEGRCLGDYRLEKLLGRGASASVWQATDLRLQMPVALKLFAPRGKAGRHLLDGVMREARAASRVVSDFVIRVKDAGHFDAEGLGFIAMELCAAFPDPGSVDATFEDGLQVGRTLEQALPDSTEEAVRLMAQVARGVAAAHREGIFHRDVKPANILVRPGSRRAQVTDFGLTVAELGGEGSVRVPVAGRRKRVILGTPEYMSPEAAQGLPAGLDPRHDRVLLTALDVYGLGASLYAILAGTPPYRARPGAEKPPLDVLEQVREDPPVDLLSLPSTHLPVSEPLARVVRRAMSRLPEDRYCSALALAEDLEAILADRPTTLDVGRPVLAGRLWLRRNRSQASAGASVAVMICALVVSAVVGVRLNGEIADGEQRIAELDAQATAAASEASRWQLQAGEAEQLAAQARDREEAAHAAVAKTRSNLSATRRELRATAGELATTESDRDDWRSQAEQNASERDATQAVADAQTQRAEVAESERDAALDSATSQRLRAEQAEASLIAARSDAAELQRGLASERARRTSAEAQAADLVGELRAASAERDRVAADLVSTQRTVRMLRNRVKRLEAVLAASAAPSGASPSSPSPAAP